jgi:hypothetical protein
MSKKLTQSQIKSFWTLEPKKREATRKLADRIEQQAQLEQYAEENNLLICRGKAYTWEEYPCSCELGDPSRCQAEKNERRGLGHEKAVCKCRCHLLYEGGC